MTNALPYTSLQQAGEYTLYATREYFDQLVEDIDATVGGGRVLLAAMTLDPTVPTIQRVMHSLKSAALRGVEATLEIDAHSFMVDENKMPGPLFLHKSMPAKMSKFHRQLNDTLQALSEAGADVVITNPPKRRYMSPFAGRSHIKASIINNTVYLGGCNLSSMHLDAMVRFEKPETAAWLYDLLRTRVSTPRTLEAFGTADFTHSVNAHTKIIVDVGVKRQSAIYQQALAVIDNAKDWLVISCQFFPNSDTAKRLRAAQERGVQVVPIFNHYSAHSPVHAHLQHAVTSRERLRMPASFFETETAKGQTFLHAKILATEKEAMIGSHNYIPSGVNFGTAEIALHSRDTQFSRACVAVLLEETGFSLDLIKT
jgi:phosphatidylserine/phosphatidylglycerophosphate/cardiolipin synthase-like enzyme